MIARSLCLGLMAGVGICSTVYAAEVEVRLKNQGADGFMVFEPSLVKIKPGDSVKFVAADQGHNAESIKAIAPEGAASFKGEIGKDITVTFDKAGVYGVKCSPHFAMGMTALVAVGDAYPNLDAAKAAKLPGEAKKRIDADFAKLGQ